MHNSAFKRYTNRMNVSTTPIIISLATSMLVALIAIPLVIRICRAQGYYDLPNVRKVHKLPIPRLGGVVFLPCMIAGFAAGLAMLMGGFNQTFNINVSTIAMTSGAFIIYLIGVLDDIREMRATHKFIIQFAAALIFPFCNLIINDMHGIFGLHIIPIYISYPLTVFVILLIVNAMNLIDGIDGLSSGLSILILCTFGVMYWQLNIYNFSIISFSLAGALISFFIYNMFGKVGKNKVFMGDSGSLFLGYMIAYLAIKFQMSNSDVLPYREHSLLTSYTLLIIPTFDVIRVALQRLYNHKGIFTPDKTHIHHLIMQAGASMHWALIVILLLFASFCGLNYGLNVFGVADAFIIGIDILIYTFFIYFLTYMKPEIERN